VKDYLQENLKKLKSGASSVIYRQWSEKHCYWLRSKETIEKKEDG